MSPGACHCSADQYFVESAESGYKFDRELIGEVPPPPLSSQFQTHILNQSGVNQSGVNLVPWYLRTYQAVITYHTRHTRIAGCTRVLLQ
jgi:hypothetical protein